MPRERRLHCDVRRFGVAHFTDQDHVGIVTKNGPQRVGKSETGARIHGQLYDAIKTVFHGIFDRHHLHARRAAFAQRRVQRGGFSRTGRTAHEQQARGALQQGTPLCEHVGIEAQRLERRRLIGVSAIEQAQHDTFAMQGRQGGNAHIEFPVAHPHPGTTVLRQSPFGNVETGQHLQAGNDRRPEFGSELLRVA